MHWAEVLQRRDDILGGDIITYERFYMYRGPISDISLLNGHIHIESLWIARLDIYLPEGWAYWKSRAKISVSIGVEPVHLGQGNMVGFKLQDIGGGMIIPSDHKKLNPALVKGIKLP